MRLALFDALLHQIADGHKSIKLGDDAALGGERGKGERE